MEIARGLATHFNDDALERMPGDLAEHRLLVAEDDGRIVGFLTVLEGDRQAEISWMGVRRELHRRGIGRTLMAMAETLLIRRGVRKLIVRTLADTVVYEPYEATRRFYESMGFRLLEVIDPYTGWSPGNPCSVYVKDLG